MTEGLHAASVHRLRLAQRQRVSDLDVCVVEFRYCGYRTRWLRFTVDDGQQHLGAYPEVWVRGIARLVHYDQI